MTIAAAATFPWGFLRMALKSLPGAKASNCVILATDSRWTYGDRSPEDMGQKLWKLAPKHGVGAVFAGDVRSAEEALESCQRRIELLPRLDTPIVVEVVSQALCQVYSAHRDRRKNVGPLFVLLGIAGGSGEASVVRLSSDEFVPEIVQGDVQVIGWPSARAKLLDKLAEQEDAFLKGGTVWRLDPREWALRLAGTLFTEVIEPGDETSVGGGVQVAMVNSGQWVDLTVARLSEPIETAEWQLISADPEKLKRYRKHFHIPPLADGGFDLGFASLARKELAVP